jgi:hypothetical protein
LPRSSSGDSGTRRSSSETPGSGAEATAHYGALFGAHVGLAWVLTSFGVAYAFEGRPLSLLMINGGYHVVSFVLMGTILGAW